MEITKRILSDPVNRWVFSIADTDVFLVGGYIRDILRGVLSKDKDYILKDNVMDIAKESAKRFKGTFIPLKPPTAYRVVLRSKEVLDFSALVGSITEDLKRRDFTINAIAWSPKTGIIDPFEGISDLNNHILRVVRMRNLSADPLRIIRAYRFAVELGLRIEENTKKGLGRYAKGLGRVSEERITEELFKILSNKDAATPLNECYKDSVLGRIFLINRDELVSNLKLINKFGLLLKALPKKLDKILEENVSQGLNRAGIVRLALLLMNAGNFKNTRLKVSRSIKKALRDIHTGYSIGKAGASLSARLFKIFNVAEESIFEMAVVLSITKGYDIKSLLNKAEEYLKVKNKILLNGNDIQKILNIPPGERIGKILLSLQEEQFKGLIKTKAQARQWLMLNLT